MTDPADFEPDTATTTRRNVLRTASLVALAGGSAAALAGCSSATEPATPGAAPSSAAPRPAESSAAPSGSAGGEQPAGTSVPKASVPEAGGVVVKEKYVVTQPSAGKFKAFSAICTHKGCPVTKVENKEIQCPCHGSRFSIEDGSPVGGPAEEALPDIGFTESGDNIVLAD
jgi:Rieske Fe-S protein